MPRKGTPEYEVWLKKYREGRKPAKEDEPKKASSSKRLSGLGEVFSASSNKSMKVDIMKFDEKKGKYLVKREDGRYLYYSADAISPLAKPKEEPKVKREEAIVPEGSKSAAIEKLLKPVTLDISKTGIKVNSEVLEKLDAKYKAQALNFEKEAIEKAGYVFNLNNPKETAVALYDSMKLEDVSGKRATDAKTLAILSMQGNPIADDIIGYRSSRRMVTAYTSKLDNMKSSDSRVRNELDTKAVSGRFTSVGTIYKQELPVPEGFEAEDKIYSPEELMEKGVPGACK